MHSCFLLALLLNKHILFLHESMYISVRSSKHIMLENAFVKFPVAKQNIYKFASNLTPLLICLKLTLICCEVVPLIRNSLSLRL